MAANDNYTVAPNVDVTATPELQKLSTVLSYAADTLPEGYKVRVTSGISPRELTPNSQHPLGRAVDAHMYGPSGAEIPNEGEDNSGLWSRFASAAYYQHQKYFPEDKGKLAWGGNFDTYPGSGVKDLMHFDYGGDRGHYGTLAQVAAQYPEMKSILGQQKGTKVAGGDLSDMLRDVAGDQNKLAPDPQGATPVAPTHDHGAADLASMLSFVNGTDSHAGTSNRYAIPPTEGTLEGIGHFFRAAGQSAKRGLADQLGFPIDTVNSMSRFYTAQGVDPNTGMSYGPPGNPTSITIPGGADTIRRLAGKIGIDTNLPSETGDVSNPAHWGEALGYAGGASALFMPGSAIGAGLKAGAGITKPLIAAGMRMLKDSALNLLAGGGGRELADTLESATGSKAAEAVGNIAGTAGTSLAVGGAITAARLLQVAGLHALEKSGIPQVSQLIRGTFNPGATLRNVADNPEQAAKNALAGGGIAGPGEALPEGFQTPAATASMDTPTQALMHVVAGKDAEFNAQYRQLLTHNENVLQNMQPSGAGTGDVAAHLQNLQAARVSAKEELLNQSVDQADRDLQIATKDSTYNPDESPNLKRAYESNLKNQLTYAWAESTAATRAEFEAAKAAGLDKATVPTTRLYDKLADMMSEHIQSGMADKHFPTEPLKTLYEPANPLRLFDSGGHPVGNLSESYMLSQTEPWQRIQGLYNDIDSQLHQLMRQGGDPIKQQWLMRMQDETLATMRDMRMEGGKFAPGTLPAALQNALNSAAENRRLFVDSPVGKLLGFNNEGLLLPDAGTSIKQWLGNSPSTMQKVQSMFDAVGQQSLVLGQHPANALKQNMDNMLRQEFTDNYRQGGVKAAGRWLENNNALLEHPQFQPLQDEFRQSLNNRTVAESLQATTPKDIADIRRNRAELFLKGEPGQELDSALARGDKFTATREIIQDLKQDPTGKAMEGFANMAFERMMGKASQANPGGFPGGNFSGAQAAKYFNENKGMFDAINREIPGFSDRAQQWVNGAQMMDRIQAKPQGIPLDKSEVELSLTGLGGLMARIVGADIGRKLGTGTIQVPGITSRLAQTVYNQFASKLPADRAAALISRAMIEPETFAKLMSPMTTPQAAQETSLLLQPYMLSAPSVIYNTQQQHQNPQKPMPNE